MLIKYKVFRLRDIRSLNKYLGLDTKGVGG